MFFSINSSLILLCFKFTNILFINGDLLYLDPAKSYYTPDDEVILLDVEILESLFYEVPNVWILHLHKNGCKNCTQFAKLWKRIAIDFVAANDLIKFGEFDCSISQHVNLNVCKDIKKANETMMLRYFPEMFATASKNGGKPLKMDFDIAKLKKTVINFVMLEMKQGYAKSFPKLEPYTSPNATNLFKEARNGTKYGILLIDSDISLLSIEMALDFHLISNVSVRYCNKNNTALINKLQITKFPTMLIISVNGSIENVTVNVTDKIKLENVIQGFIKPIPVTETKPSTVNVKKLEKKKKTKQHFDLKSKGNYTFLMDLETALRYSFKKEIGILDNIKDQEYDALMAYINVILKYFPFNEKGRRFVSELKQIILNPILVISGKKILYIFRAVEKRHSDLFTFEEEWFACDRNTSEYHQYLCGFWKLFHYFTVRAAEVKSYDEKDRCLEVLKTLQNYIKYFMKNRNYTRNALEIMDGDFNENVDSFDGAILWLWTVHNALNDRFSEETNQDPSYPKIQFPSTEDCPLCRSKDNTWNVDEVLRYIKQIHSNFTIPEVSSYQTMISVDFILLLDYVLHILLYLTSGCLILTLGHMLFRKCLRNLKNFFR